MSSPADRRFYSSQAWRSLRLVILLRDGYRCCMCGTILKAGRRGDRAAIVDHIRPLALRPDLGLDEGNLWSVCSGCHDRTCTSIEARHAGDADAIAAAKAAWRPVGIDGYPAGWA